MMSEHLFFGIVFFVIAIYIYIRKKSIGKESYIWLYSSWFLMTISILGYPGYIQYIMRAFSLAFSWFVLLNYINKIRIVKSVMSINILLFCFVAICSTVYSVDPTQTFIKAIEIITDFLLIVVIVKIEGKELAVKKLMSITIKTIFVIICITLVGVFLAPSFFADHGYAASKTFFGFRFGNGIIGANSVGSGAVLVISWTTLTKKISKKEMIELGICLIALILSQSRGSLVLLPFIILLRIFKPKDKHKYLYIIGIVLLVAYGSSKIDILMGYVIRGQNSGELSSLSGRTMMWKYALDYIKKSPIIGYGFGSGGEMVGNLLPDSFNGMQHMHNGFIETLLGTGIIGTLLISIQLLYVIIVISINILKMGIKKNMIDIIFVMFFITRTILSTGIGNWHSSELMIWYLFIYTIRVGKSFQEYCSLLNENFYNQNKDAYEISKIPMISMQEK